MLFKGIEGPRLQIDGSTNPDGTPDEEMASHRISAVETVINMQNDLPGVFRPYMGLERKL